MYAGYCQVKIGYGVQISLGIVLQCWQMSSQNDPPAKPLKWSIRVSSYSWNARPSLRSHHTYLAFFWAWSECHITGGKRDASVSAFSLCFQQVESIFHNCYLGLRQSYGIACTLWSINSFDPILMPYVLLQQFSTWLQSFAALKLVGRNKRKMDTWQGIDKVIFDLLLYWARTCQSYSGDPHNCPVSEKASGGTPLTMTGAPVSPSSNRSGKHHTSALWAPT